MSAGKGSVRRPYTGQAWDEGYARIDFSAVRKTTQPAKQPEAVEERSPEVPTPDASGRCSSGCPMFDYELMRGWPTMEVCFAWEEGLDGPEPHQLSGCVCKPALRRAAINPSYSER